MTAAVARADAVVLVRAAGAPRDLDRPAVRIAVNRGGHLERVARERLRSATLVPVDDNRRLPELLASREVAAIVTDTLEAATFDARAFRVAARLARDRKAYWVAPGREDLAADLDAWLLARERDGTLEHLRAEGSMPRTPCRYRSRSPASWTPWRAGLMVMPEVAAAKRAAGLPSSMPRARPRSSRVPSSARGRRPRSHGRRPSRAARRSARRAPCKRRRRPPRRHARPTRRRSTSLRTPHRRARRRRGAVAREACARLERATPHGATRRPWPIQDAPAASTVGARGRAPRRRRSPRVRRGACRRDRRRRRRDVADARPMIRTTLLFVATATAEILGCYLPWLWLRAGRSPGSCPGRRESRAVRLAADVASGLGGGPH
jgi:hypothetical protein